VHWPQLSTYAAQSAAGFSSSKIVNICRVQYGVAQGSCMPAANVAPSQVNRVWLSCVCLSVALIELHCLSKKPL
jgi:hypothetical protein